MLSDEKLNRLRQQFVDAAIATVPAGDRAATWDNLVFDPSAATMRPFLGDNGVPVDVQLAVVEAVLQIGYDCASEVLAGVPLPLAEVPDRRWRLRRELARAIEVIDDNALQSLVYTARSLAPGQLLEIDDPYLEEITAAIKPSRALDRARSAEVRHGARVVATADTLGGQVRIDGTRMPVAMLLIYLGSMTESEISREWAHLPPGWLDAIVAWVDGQRMGGD